MKIFCSLLAAAVLICSVVGFAGCGTQSAASDPDVTEMFEQEGGGTFRSPNDMESKFFPELLQ